MPTYEYKCKTCGDAFEEYQSIKADPLTQCKKEGCAGPVERLFSAGAGFLFKGSGFYITDYRSDSYKKGAKADSSGGAAPAASTPSSTPAASAPSSTPSAS